LKLIKNLLQVLSTGYIFVYFSEHLFWARLCPDDSLMGWLAEKLVVQTAYEMLPLSISFTVPGARSNRPLTPSGLGSYLILTLPLQEGV
jgi:hypothetical protein